MDTDTGTLSVRLEWFELSADRQLVEQVWCLLHRLSAWVTVFCSSRMEKTSEHQIGDYNAKLGFPSS